MTQPEKNEPIAQDSRGDLEACTSRSESNSDNDSNADPTSAFKQLGILDQFLAVWIFLAMAVGIILGNFVPNTSEALDRGKFVGVSIPIGKLLVFG